MHEQYYRFKCPDCDHLSMLRENVAKHYRNMHLDEKLYACNQCEYRTGYTHLLKLHLMAHAGIRPYKCTACEYQVNNVNKVTRHIKTRHNGQVGITYEKLDLDFEVDAKQFQCQNKTCDKDINVIEVNEEQVKEILQTVKKKKLAKEKLKLKIPVFNPKKMKQKMVSILPQTVKSPDKTNLGELTGNVHKIPDQQVNIKDKVTLGSVKSRGSEKQDIPLKRTKPYSGVENKVSSDNDVSICLTADKLFRNQNKSEPTNNELESEYQCSMCDFRLKSHSDIAQHLLVCKMERNKMT